MMQQDTRGMNGSTHPQQVGGPDVIDDVRHLHIHASEEAHLNGREEHETAPV